MRAPWYVAAGWAIDLFVGRERREHEDLEIGVPRERFREIAHALRDYELIVPRGEMRVGAYEPGLESHQTWVRERDTGIWRLDVFREPSEGDTWVCRRDETIRMPYAELIERTRDGIPYARPEVVLLFKAKAARDKDESDLADVLPLLGAERRAFLHDLLARVHPGHAWLAKIVRADDDAQQRSE